MLPNLASLTADVGSKYTIEMAIADREKAERKLEDYMSKWGDNPVDTNRKEQLEIRKRNVAKLMSLVKNWEMPLKESVKLEPTVN